MEDSVPKYDLFQKAYKKLKSTAYYDKTNLHLRDRIAEAENTCLLYTSDAADE